MYRMLVRIRCNVCFIIFAALFFNNFVNQSNSFCFVVTILRKS